jgi:ATP-binding cassette subfamily B multidrug efflux pump
MADSKKSPSRNKLDWGLLKHFLTYLHPYKRQVIIGFIPVPLSVFCSIAFPWLIMQVIDRQLVTGQWQGMSYWLVLLVTVFITNYAASTIYSYYLQMATQFAIRDLRNSLFNRVLHFPRKYFDTTPMGVTLTRLTSDLEAINESLASGLLSMIRDLLITIAMLIFLASISWQLTLMTIVVAPPMYLVIRYLRHRLHRVYLQSRQVLSAGTGYLQECLQGIKTVQLYSAEKQVQQHYQTYTQKFYNTQSKSNLYDSALFSIIEGITTITMGLIIWYGATQVMAAAVTVGVLVGFIQTLDKIFVPIRDITSQIASIQRAFASLEHINEIFDQPLEEDRQLSIESPDVIKSLAKQFEKFESLEFSHVKFRYNEDSPYVLNDVSFRLDQGKKIALVGSTGSGKSTILRLLTKTYDSYEGHILVNGIELANIPKTLLVNLFSMMQQEVFLFNKSIEFNIGLGRENIDIHTIKAATRYVYADEFIEQLPGSYQFTLENNGSNISAGQGQLLAFARAIASGSDVILLDEATSSVDSITERLIQRAIDHVFEEKTVIAIAHRLSTIQHSDEILVLDKGGIVERGSHQHLLDLGGFYDSLVNGQDAVVG